MDIELLNVADVARRLRVTPKTVLRHVREGKLPTIRLSRKLLRFRSDVLEGLEKSTLDLCDERPAIRA